MKRLFPLPVASFLIAICMLCGMLAGAQDSLKTAGSSDFLSYEKDGGSWKAKQKGRELTQDELFFVLNSDYESAEYVGKFKTKNTIGAILGGFGGAFIGFPIGAAIAGGEPQWIMALAGVGVLAIAIPVGISAGKDIRKGVDVYNQNRGPSAQLQKPKLHIGGQQGGVGLALRF